MIFKNSYPSFIRITPYHLSLVEFHACIFHCKACTYKVYPSRCQKIPAYSYICVTNEHCSVYERLRRLLKIFVCSKLCYIRDHSIKFVLRDANTVRTGKYSISFDKDNLNTNVPCMRSIFLRQLQNGYLFMISTDSFLMTQ